MEIIIIVARKRQRREKYKEIFLVTAALTPKRIKTTGLNKIVRRRNSSRGRTAGFSVRGRIHCLK
jgi:hypothetical protein